MLAEDKPTQTFVSFLPFNATMQTSARPLCELLLHFFHADRHPHNTFYVRCRATARSIKSPTMGLSVCLNQQKNNLCNNTKHLAKEHVCWTQTQPSYLVVSVPMRGAFYPLTVDCHLSSGCSLIHRPANETKQEGRDAREGVVHLNRKQAGKMKSWYSCRRHREMKNPLTHHSESNMKV